MSAPALAKVEEILGKSVTEVMPREDEGGNRLLFEERILPRVLANKTTVVSITTYCIRKDGSRFPAASMVTPIQVEHEIIGSVEVFRDITKEKEIDQAKSDFISIASHQLRTPLSAFKWVTESLLEGKKLTVDQK